MKKLAKRGVYEYGKLCLTFYPAGLWRWEQYWKDKL